MRGPGHGPRNLLVHNYDLEFLKKFSLVLGFLVLVAVGLIVGADFIDKQVPRPAHPDAPELTRERIAPFGAVYAGSTGAAQQAAAAAAAQGAPQGAYGGTLDGGEIYNQLCTGCHTSGAGGAPTLTAAGMGARAGKGKDTLYQNAINGFTGSAGVMPPRGGNPELTDDQVKAVVDWMLANVK